MVSMEWTPYVLSTGNPFVAKEWATDYLLEVEVKAVKIIILAYSSALPI